MARPSGELFFYKSQKIYISSKKWNTFIGKGPISDLRWVSRSDFKFRKLGRSILELLMHLHELSVPASGIYSQNSNSNSNSNLFTVDIDTIVSCPKINKISQIPCQMKDRSLFPIKMSNFFDKKYNFDFIRNKSNISPDGRVINMLLLVVWWWWVEGGSSITPL